MKIVIQRVEHASVKVDGNICGKIGKGYLVLLGIGQEDTEKDCERLAAKMINLRIFSDENGKTNLSLKDVGGELLIISQFTLYADTKKGNRPSYINALNGEEATKLYDLFNEELRNNDIKVETGIFGSAIKATFTNL